MTDQAVGSVRTEIAQIIEALETGKYKRVRKRLRHMHPAKIASLIASSGYCSASGASGSASTTASSRSWIPMFL